MVGRQEERGCEGGLLHMLIWLVGRRRGDVRAAVSVPVGIMEAHQSL